MMPRYRPLRSTTGYPGCLRGPGAKKYPRTTPRSGIEAGTVTPSVVITSPMLSRSSGSMAYSRVTWYPRRATFSVRIDRFVTSTVRPCAMTEAIRSAGRTLMSWVSSRAKIVPVSGDRIVPPSAADMRTRGQSAASPPARTGEARAPGAPPGGALRIAKVGLGGAGRGRRGVGAGRRGIGAGRQGVAHGRPLGGPGCGALVGFTGEVAGVALGIAVQIGCWDPPH